MFFIISKLLAFLIRPVTWVFIFLLYSLFSRSPKRKRKALLVAILTLFIFSNKFLINEVVMLWEVPVNNIDKDKKYDYAIILGGYSVYDEDWARIEFIGAADRLFVPLQMYQKKQVDNFILSGGGGDIYHPERREAIGVKNFLMDLNVREKNILPEIYSKNTHENAAFVRQLIDSLDINDKSFLLVTSAIHMRRARACFEKEGVQFDILSVDKTSADRIFHPSVFLLPSSGVLSGWYYLLHEMIGYISYWFAGYV